MKKSIVFISVLVIVFFLTSCSDVIDVSGTWTGVITETHPGEESGPIEFVITQDKEDLEGEVDIGMGAYILDFTGTIDGNTITGTCVNVEDENDTTDIEATVERDEMTGTWENVGGQGGTFAVTQD